MQHDHASFRIQEIPATGAYGVVCIAQSTSDANRVVAIKVLQLDQGAQQDLLRRARDEARMLSRLDHPNLVRVEPVLEIKGRATVVMEYVRGVTVRQLIRSAGVGLPCLESLAIIQGSALGLEAAWASPMGSDGEPMNIVHRDIKPGNLMVSTSGAVKVVDFGLAKGSFTDREAESMVFVRGSRGYMAPERYDGDDTPKGDVYALGLSLFEMLSGKHAVVSLRWDRHDTDMQKAVQHIAMPELAEPVGVAVRELVMSCCRYEADERPNSGQLARQIEDIFELAGVQPDLLGFAQQRVAPLYEARAITPPEEHPHYSEVRFLEDDATREYFDVDGEVERLVGSPDFPMRAQELVALLSAHPTANIGPLLDVLDRANSPPWIFWRSPPAPERTVAALHVLRVHPVDPVKVRAKRLLKHRNESIAVAARAILVQR